MKDRYRIQGGLMNIITRVVESLRTLAGESFVARLQAAVAAVEARRDSRVARRGDIGWSSRKGGARSREFTAELVDLQRALSYVVGRGSVEQELQAALGGLVAAQEQADRAEASVA
jgi:hypothetical protein